MLDRGYANFYEKALFVKPTWRQRYVVGTRPLCPSRAMLLSAENLPSMRSGE
jgi:hypothetical protein